MSEELKPHELRELVNALTDAAKKYAGTEQLRANISEIVCEALESRPATAAAVQGEVVANAELIEELKLTADMICDDELGKEDSLSLLLLRAIAAIRGSEKAATPKPSCRLCGGRGFVHLPVADGFERKSCVACSASAAPAVAGVPEGMVLVPVEPTPAMVVAAWDGLSAVINGTSYNKAGASIYRAMLAAAPAAPSAQEGKVLSDPPGVLECLTKHSIDIAPVAAEAVAQGGGVDVAEVAALNCPNAAGFEGPETFPDCGKCVVCRARAPLTAPPAKKSQTEKGHE